MSMIVAPLFFSRARKLVSIPVFRCVTMGCRRHVPMSHVAILSRQHPFKFPHRNSGGPAKIGTRFAARYEVGA